MSAKPVIYKNRKKCHVKIKKYKKSNLNYFFLINKFFGRLFMSFRNDYIHSFIADLFCKYFAFSSLSNKEVRGLSTIE